MFPKLDGDLGSVAANFRFDNLDVVGAEEAKDATELKTPLQPTSGKQFLLSSDTFDEQIVRLSRLLIHFKTYS